MSLIDENERVKLKEWAALGTTINQFKMDGDKERDSFWITRNQADSYIMEYDFATLPEFENLCKKMMRMRLEGKVQKVVSVATFKNIAKTKPEDIGQEGLPEYRYTF